MKQDIPNNALFRHLHAQLAALQDMSTRLEGVAVGVERIAAAQELEAGKPPSPAPSAFDEHAQRAAYRLINTIEDEALKGNPPDASNVASLQRLFAYFGLQPQASLNALSSGDTSRQICACTALYAVVLGDKERLVSATLSDDHRECLRAHNTAEGHFTSKGVWETYPPDAATVNAQLAQMCSAGSWRDRVETAFKNLNFDDADDFYEHLKPWDPKTESLMTRLKPLSDLRSDIIGASVAGSATSPSSPAPAGSPTASGTHNKRKATP